MATPVKLLDDLLNKGTLPKVEVEITKETIVQLTIIITQIIKQISK